MLNFAKFENSKITSSFKDLCAGNDDLEVHALEGGGTPKTYRNIQGEKGLKIDEC